MPIHQRRKATLGELEGTGFAFVRKPRQDKRQRGIFVSDESDAIIDEIQEGDRLEFEGVVYYPKSHIHETFEVEVEDIINVPLGHRVDFIAVEDED